MYSLADSSSHPLVAFLVIVVEIKLISGLVSSIPSLHANHEVIDKVADQLQSHARGNQRACQSGRASGPKQNVVGIECELERHFLRNKTVTCNDGSPAGYYLKKSTVGSTRWLIFLEGGWFCFDDKSCRARWVTTPNLMTSNYWPTTKKGQGILSWDLAENPFIHDGNLVSVPYCSSDAWTGSAPASQTDQYSYFGAHIVEEVVLDLLHLHGLDSATKLYLAGTSAGGTGVLLNVDRVADLVNRGGPKGRRTARVEVRGIADSGWFLNNIQYRPVECTDSHTCSPSESVQRGIKLWKGVVPESCRVKNRDDPWKCYFGNVLYNSIKTPVFVIQHLFDEGQLIANNVGPPMYSRQWQYIRDVGADMKHSLTNISAGFAPACMSHMLITKREWWKVEVHGVSLTNALICWDLNEDMNSNIHHIQDKQTEKEQRQQRKKIKQLEKRLQKQQDKKQKQQQQKKDSSVESANDKVIAAAWRKGSKNTDQSPSKKKRRNHQYRDTRPGPSRNFRVSVNSESSNKNKNEDLSYDDDDERFILNFIRKSNPNNTESLVDLLRIATNQHLPENSYQNLPPRWRKLLGKSLRRQRSSNISDNPTDNLELSRIRHNNHHNNNNTDYLSNINSMTDTKTSKTLRRLRRRLRTSRSEKKRKRQLERQEAVCRTLLPVRGPVMDSCSWPQCNPTCPRIRNPFTGSAMNFEDLLAQFALTLEELSRRTGIREDVLPTLNHGQLLQLLIESSSQ